MKKLIVCVLLLAALLTLVSCGTKKCHTCGENLSDGAYQAFGNDYCSDCFMNDLGL